MRIIRDKIENLQRFWHENRATIAVAGSISLLLNIAHIGYEEYQDYKTTQKTLNKTKKEIRYVKNEQRVKPKP